MAYIGKQPINGNFVKIDAIVTSATTTFNLLNGGVAYFPQSANNCIVSLNGIIQEPTSSGNVGGYTISGSTIVFTSALTTLDVIDFILVLGDTLSIGTPSDGTVSFAKVTSNLITGATAETSIAGGDSVLIYDDSASALRKMTRTNFVAGISGGIIQVKTARQTASESFTADNTMLGPTATITPTSASSKILVMVQGMTSFSSTTVTGTMGLRYATGTSVANTDTLVGGGDASGIRSRGIAWSGQNSDAWQGVNISYHILHDPATTSQISYRLCHLGNDSSATGYLGRTGRDTNDNRHPRNDTNITLIEIGSSIL
jgi:hypothetical protein